MTLLSRASVVQGFFPAASALSRWSPSNRSAQLNPVPGSVNFQQLTPQARRRSSSAALPRSASKYAFAVPPHLSHFGGRTGQKLPPAVQQKMESFFSADFSDVQVHSGPEASAIGALAFTTGSNIYFAPGQYNPNSHLGQQLLAHELTHVVQQRAGRVRNPFGSGVAVIQDPALEAEAERMGRQAATHVPLAQPRLAPSPVQQAETIHVSAPLKLQEGSYKITAQDKGRPVGSVMVHKRGRAIEVTDLGVEAGQRGKGFGQRLLGSAVRAGLRLGTSRVKLGVDDNGSGKLTKWYRLMGFRQTGLDWQGRPQMEAPIHRLRSGIAQGRMASPFPTEALRKGAIAQRAATDIAEGDGGVKQAGDGIKADITSCGFVLGYGTSGIAVYHWPFMLNTSEHFNKFDGYVQQVGKLSKIEVYTGPIKQSSKELYTKTTEAIYAKYKVPTVHYIYGTDLRGETIYLTLKATGAVPLDTTTVFLSLPQQKN